MNQDYKYDGGKPRMDLLMGDCNKSVKDIAEVLTFGAEKYSAKSWRNVEQERYVAALYRHLNAWHAGEELDQESGMTHLAHALTNLVFINELN